jgi:hypothetical protein
MAAVVGQGMFRHVGLDEVDHLTRKSATQVPHHRVVTLTDTRPQVMSQTP